MACRPEWNSPDEMPNVMTMLGHEDAWNQWRDALAGERMHHAWMLAGRKGLGKMHFALAAAQELVSNSGVNLDARRHPDIHILNRLPKDDKEEKKRAEGKPFETKRSISVAQIREMQQRLTTRPTMGNKRAIIVDPSDDLEKSASNALLKSLEEPPQGTFFILIAHRPARLLPTIRSRCRIVRFPVLSDEAMRNFLSSQAPEADQAAHEAALIAASGSPGAALDFVERDLGTLFTLMQTILRDGDLDFQLRGRLAETIGARPNRERIQATLDLARAVIAGEVENAPQDRYPDIVEAHAELVRLTGQAPTFNFDAGLLVAEIGTLLATAAGTRERTNV